MNKAQKWTIKICLLLIVVSVLIPPLTYFHYTKSNVDNSDRIEIIKVEWGFIWATRSPEFNRAFDREAPLSSNNPIIISGFFQEVKFGFLILEWIAIIALGGFFFIYFRKIN